MLNIKKEIKNGKAVFKLDGRLDTTTAPELEKTLKESLDGVTALTLDMDKLEYVSSAGLRVLLEAHMNMLMRKGSMKLVHVGDMVMKILEVTGFKDVLTIE